MRMGAAVFGAGCVIAAACLFPAYWWVLRPIGRLTSAIREVGKSGDHRKRLDVDSSDEVAEVTGQVNTLLDKLQSQSESMARRTAELEESRDRAVAASMAKTDFLASMSHEIRTPMTAILGFAELLIDDKGQPASQSACLDAARTITRQGAHLLGVINGVLDLSKIEAGQMTAEATECSPITIVEEVRTLLGNRAASDGLDLKVELQFPLPSVIVSDPQRIRQVLLNIVGNAIKFTPPPPQSPGRIALRIRAARTSEGVSTIVFECSDTGVGIDDALIKKLFQPFTQSTAGASRKFVGSGLGLTISRRFAQLLGGDISVHRHTDAPGTTFELTLPIRESASTVWIRTEAQLTLARKGVDSDHAEDTTLISTLDGRVLLAEDGLDNQRLIAHYLLKAGAQVDIAANGRIALQMARQASETGGYDLVLLDMQMPELDGYGAASELRAAGFDRPIIALTAHALAGDRQRCLDAGCNDYLTKPVDRLALVNACARWIKQSRSGAKRDTPMPQNKAA